MRGLVSDLEQRMAASPLTIRIKKNADGSAVLTCTRADGSVTWQRQLGPHGAFFPRHDLTHYAVETVLGHPQSFYGLVATGWDISDFGPPWKKGPLTQEAGYTELIVGFLDSERASLTRWSAEEFNEKAAIFYRDRKIAEAPPKLTDDDLDRVRARRSELFQRWDAVPPGDALELMFDPRALGAIVR
jgi:hypothetical protein